MVDFRDQLRRQIAFLKNSCQLYDQGHVEEAVRIAVTLRVLFHDSKSSVSLLQHLGSKSILLLSTATEFVEDKEMPNLCLVDLVASIPNFRGDSRPLLDKAYRTEKVPFHTWWRKELVIELKGGLGDLNRRDLVLAAANKDGGAHVDQALEPTYEKARLGAGISVEFVLKNGLPPVKLHFENVHFASLRQMGYEVLNSQALLALARK